MGVRYTTPNNTTNGFQSTGGHHNTRPDYDNGDDGGGDFGGDFNEDPVTDPSSSNNNWGDPNYP